MRLTNLYVHNYKSLRHITFSPGHFVCIVGPNASGKTNFADALDFLSEVYSHGLEVAIARKGGFENIAFRKQRRSKASIDFLIRIEVPADSMYWMSTRRKHSASQGLLRIEHRFSIAAMGTGIRAEFRVREENLLVERIDNQQSEHVPVESTHLWLDAHGKLHSEITGQGVVADEMGHFISIFKEFSSDSRFSKQSLWLTSFHFGGSISFAIINALSNIQVFRLSPQLSRNPGVPTPNPTLTATGENLPALVDWLQRHHQPEWEIVLNGMRDILPSLNNISVQYLHTKTLGLFFDEEGVGRSWGADDVSDGTIQTLAMFVASVDPRTSILVVEEIETSIHPWIIHAMVERLRQVSRSKNVIITTHSPVVIDQMEPSEVYVMFREQGESHLQQLTLIDSSIEAEWKAGKFRLSELLDTGLIPQAVPGGVS